MPIRAPIDPEGIYHVSSRGVYGRTLWETVGHHEMFLRMYTRRAVKYGWQTLEWALVGNHHHFVVWLTNGGLSEGLRELHGGYSRWFHKLHGETRQGHLFRHSFFARQLETDDELVTTCAYVSSNPLAFRDDPTPRPGDWSGYRAILGLEHPRRFHSPHLLLEILDRNPKLARAKHRAYVSEAHARRRQGLTPNVVS